MKSFVQIARLLDPASGFGSMNQPDAWKAASGTERERQLLLEAGAELACAGANSQSLQFFHLKWIQMREFKGTISMLGKWGLPMIVAPDEATLESNDHICSTAFPRRNETCPQRRLILAFDRTYLESSLQLFKSADGPCFAGGKQLNCLILI